MRDIQKEEIKYKEKESVKENGVVSDGKGHSVENGYKSTNDLDRDTNNLSKMVAEKKREPTECSDGEEESSAKKEPTNSVDELSQGIESLKLTKNQKIEPCPEPQIQIKKEAEESDDQDDGKKPLNTRGPMGGMGRTVLPKGYEMNMGTLYQTPTQGGKRRMDEGEDPFYKFTRPAGNDINYQQNYQNYQNGYPPNAVNYNQNNWHTMQQQPYYQEQLVINSQMTNNFSGGTVTIKSPTTEMAQNPLSNNLADDILDLVTENQCNSSAMNNCSVMPNQLDNNAYANQINVNQNNYPNKFQNGGLADKTIFPYQQQPPSSCGMDTQRDDMMNMLATVNMQQALPSQINGYSLPTDNRNEPIGARIQNNSQQVNNFNQVQKPEKRDSYLSESESDIERSPYSFQSHSPGSASMQSLSSPPPSNLSGDSGIGGLDVDSPLQQDMYQSLSPGKPMSNAGTSPPRDMFTPPTPDSRFSTIKNELLDKIDDPKIPPLPENSGHDVSTFLDTHLPELKDVLDVIGQDMIRQNKKYYQPDSEDCENKQLPPSPAGKPAPPPQSPQRPPSVPAPSSSPSIPVASANQMPPQMISGNQTTQLNPPVSVGTNALPVTSAPVVFLPPQVSNTGIANTQQVPTTTSAFVVLPGGLPVNTQMPLATGTQPNTIIIVAPPVAPAPKPKPKGPRPIKPKMPSSSQSDKNNTTVLTNTTGSKPVTATTVGQVKAKPVAPPSVVAGKPTNAPPRVNNLLNVARRMVAEISRENLPFQDDEGDTYLHVAVCRTDPNMVQALLERLMREELQGMVDVENSKRQTPLYLAVAANQPHMVCMFVKCNANPNAMAQVMSADGRSVEVKAPIHVASSMGHQYLRTLQELLKASDINLNIANSDGHTALHCAILAHGRMIKDGLYIDSIPVIEKLLKAGIDANYQDKKCGKTPLMYAIEKRDISLVEALLRMFDKQKLRSYVRSQTFDGRTCQKIAEGLKQDFPPDQWHKLWNLLDSACNGELPQIQLPYRQL